MKVYIELTDGYYEMNDPNHRIILRSHLQETGFFNIPDHKQYWSLLERSIASETEAADLFKAIKLYQVSIAPKEKKEIN